MPKQKLLPLLKALKGIKQVNARKIILNHLDEPTCESLYQLVHNVVANKKIPKRRAVNLSKSLSTHQDDLRYISKLNGNKRKKREKLASMGGFPFLALASAAIPFLTSLLLNSRKK